MRWFDIISLDVSETTICVGNRIGTTIKLWRRLEEFGLSDWFPADTDRKRRASKIVCHRIYNKITIISTEGLCLVNAENITLKLKWWNLLTALTGPGAPRG